MTHLKRIQIHHLRNLTDVSLELSPRVNLFFGDNGSGKTSFLEAISLLGMGRSFRSQKNHSLIQSEQKNTTLFTELSDSAGHRHSIGIQKNRSAQNFVRMNGETLTSAAPLAHKLPLQIINADSFRLIEGSPKDRRRFLDWMVFHVKPDFPGLWKRFQRTLKQRNSLLKNDKMSELEIMSWSPEFVNVSEKIHQLRQNTHSQLCEYFINLKDDPLAKFFSSIELDYLPGWELDLGLDLVLQQSLSRDRRYNYTHHGPHRADIKILQDGKPAGDILSRGQEKTLIVTMHWIQAKIYQDAHQQACVFLIDDLLAELDETNARQLIDRLWDFGGQLFMTGLDSEQLKKLWSDKSADDIAMFHVEQGKISPLNRI
ncbi:MAG: DNA replication and repair protein RecF [Cellvibrionaceae bacterium]|jgi:DNA replication and repair protein RecF